MSRTRWPRPSTLAMLAALMASDAAHGAAFEVAGNVALELRMSTHTSRASGIDRHAASLSAEPDFFVESEDRRHSARFVPFLRLDSADGKRSHFDVRELLYHRFEDTWELRLGVGKVFWGVTESRHLVDTINQTDLVENVDGEDKLGQPMVNLTLKRGWGVLDVFLLPGFRERTFPGPRGRLRSEPFVDADAARYESAAGRRRVDWALRWFKSVDAWDIGLAHFYGTSRAPRLLPDPAMQARLLPRYDIVHRTSLDLQATLGAMLWKLEAVLESGQGPSHLEWVAGGEYTLFSVAGSRTDLGLLFEHLMDTRGSHAIQPFENDLFLGARVALNDVQSTQLLAGVIVDLDGAGNVFSMEASRRVGDRWTLELESRLWSGIDGADLLRSFSRDDYVALTLRRFF